MNLLIDKCSGFFLILSTLEVCTTDSGSRPLTAKLQVQDEASDSLRLQVQTQCLKGLHSLYELTVHGVCTAYSDGLFSPQLFMYEIEIFFKVWSFSPPLMVVQSDEHTLPPGNHCRRQQSMFWQCCVQTACKTPNINLTNIQHHLLTVPCTAYWAIETQMCLLRSQITKA